MRKKEKVLFNRNYNMMMLVGLLIAFGYSMISTLISSYAVEIGASLTIAGTTAGIYSISALLVRPFSGIAADRVNRKYMCLLATSVICFVMLGYGLAANIGALMIIRIIHGAAFGISGTANMSLISEYIPEERMGEGLGYYGMGQVLSQVCGPSLGVAIKNRFGYHTLFYCICFLTLIAVAVLLLLKYAPAQYSTEKKEKISVQNLIARDCLIYALVAGMFSMCNGVVNSFLQLLGTSRNISGIPLFFSVNAIILFVLRLFMGKVMDKSGLTGVVNFSLIAGAVSMALLGAAYGMPLIVLSAVLKAFSQGGGQISLQTACIKKAGPARVGIATSTYYIGADIGQGIGPIVCGKIAENTNYEIMFYVTGIIMIASLVIFNMYQKREGKRVIADLAH